MVFNHLYLIKLFSCIEKWYKTILNITQYRPNCVNAVIQVKCGAGWVRVYLQVTY